MVSNLVPLKLVIQYQEYNMQHKSSGGRRFQEVKLYLYGLKENANVQWCYG